MLWRQLYKGIPKLTRMKGYVDDVGGDLVTQLRDGALDVSLSPVTDKVRALTREAIKGEHIGSGPDCDGCGESMVDAWSGDSVGWWAQPHDALAMSAAGVPLVPVAGAGAWEAASLDAFDPAVYSSGLDALDGFDASALDLGGIDEVLGELVEGVAGLFDFLGAL
jgi:hypothetical protein